MQTRSIGALDASIVGLGCNNFGGRIDEVKPVAQILRETVAEFDAAMTEISARYA